MVKLSDGKKWLVHALQIKNLGQMSFFLSVLNGLEDSDFLATQKIGN